MNSIQIETHDFGNDWGLFIDIEKNYTTHQKKQHVYINSKSFIRVHPYKINVYKQIEKNIEKNVEKNNTIFYTLKSYMSKYNCSTFYFNKLNLSFIASIILVLNFYQFTQINM
jgi:hypothetical protein